MNTYCGVPSSVLLFSPHCMLWGAQSEEHTAPLEGLGPGVLEETEHVAPVERWREGQEGTPQAPQWRRSRQVGGLREGWALQRGGTLTRGGAALRTCRGISAPRPPVLISAEAGRRRRGSQDTRGRRCSNLAGGHRAWPRCAQELLCPGSWSTPEHSSHRALDFTCLLGSATSTVSLP